MIRRTLPLLCLGFLSLSGCSLLTGPDRPAEIVVCETYTVRICGTWQRSGSTYAGSWQDGATADVDLVRFTRTEIRAERTDFGQNRDLTAVYTGTVNGRTASGSVTWTVEGTPRTGSWTAEW